MNTLEIGKKLVELCREGKNEEAVNTLFSADIVSVEVGGPPGTDTVTKGMAGVLGKGKWCMDNHISTTPNPKALGRTATALSFASILM